MINYVSGTLFTHRQMVLMALQMDGLTRTDDLVFVLAATNLPWELDAAMLRRLEKRVSFGQSLLLVHSRASKRMIIVFAFYL